MDKETSDMSTEPFVSILVPVYKVEAYLQRCIDSVLAQDFEDWEMILVDDGSPDRCPEICDEAARKDARIRVVHKENGGLPSARLAGFREARGEYLVFLDSDDWLLNGALDVLYSSITSDGGYDFVKSKVLRRNDEGKEWIEHYPFEEGIINDQGIILDYIFCNKVSPYLHSGIYRKDIFRDEYFHQVINSGLSIGEDWVMNVLISQHTKRIKMIETPTFFYYWNSQSMMTSSVLSTRHPNIVKQALGSFLLIAPDSIKKRFECMEMSNYIRSFFAPEIPFSYSLYDKVFLFIKKDDNLIHIKKFVSCKYLYFINYRAIFYMYTWIYRLLYYHIKLKHHCRNVYPL